MLLGFCVLLFSPVLAQGSGLIVAFKPGTSPAERARALRNSAQVRPLARGGLQLQAIAAPSPSVQLVRLREGVSDAAELARLAQLPGVAYAEPNYPVRLFAEPEPVLPNDFEFARQYSLLNSGTNNGRAQADIGAPKAWAIATSSTNIVVAVIDTGVDYFHEDLRENLWHNPGEIPGNGLDDDGNGWIDDLLGYDIVSDDSDPFDDNEHGTHVTGIIAARGNNSLGIAGLCWTASVMTVKAFDQDGNGSVADAIAAIHYAVENGARIVNASWGIDEKSRALEEACQYAADRGVLIVAAAGNGRTDAPAYPASFESVLSVAATDNRDNRAGFSNYGPTVDLAAPGAEIFSTLPENRYGLASGTSMAAPHVTGVAALVLARFPFYSRQELFDILVNSVDPVLFDQPVGAGRLNAYLAVRMDQPLPIARLSVPPLLSGRESISGTALGTFFSGYTLRAGSGLYPTNWITLAVSTASASNAVLAQFDSSLLPDGAAQIQLVVTNRNGLTGAALAPVRILNTYISSPGSGDLLPPGQYPVRGTVFGEGKTFELSVGSGLEPKDWRVLSTGNSGQATNILLGGWDATGAPAGLYSLRLAVRNPDGGQTEFLSPAIYLDRELKPGWPAYLPVDRDFPPTDWRNVRVADLDGDGKSELILADPGTKNRPQRLLVYSHDGQLEWSKTLGFDIPPDLPAIGDLDGDGRSEVFIDGTNGIAAFHHDGTPVAGWPVVTRRANHAKVLADLDRDGQLELIAYSQEYAATQVGETRDLAVYRADGTLLRLWELPWCGFTNAVQKISPAAANIDADPELEIVVPSGCQEIAAFDYRRGEPKWRAPTRASILSSPVIGDVDGRDGPDIVAAAAIENGVAEGGVYVWRGDGQPWLGFPVLEEYSFTSPPALADLDADGRLEIILSSIATAALHVLQWDGFEAEGWPKPITDTAWHNTVSSADVDGDERPDVLLTAPGYINLAVLFNEYRWAGGISAFRFSGEEIRISGNDSFKPRLLESATARWHRAGPAVVCDLEGDGVLDLVSASILDRTYGTYTRVKERSSLYAWNMGVPFRPASNPWPMFGHDPQNSGAYSLPIVPVPPPTNATLAIRDRVLTVEDRPVRIDPLRNDFGPALSIAGFTSPTNGIVTLLPDHTLLYTPAADRAGIDSFDYTILSAGGLASTGRVVIRVKALNDPPTVQDMQLVINKNATADFFFDGTDAENDPLTFRIITTPKNGEAWNYPTVGSYYPRKGFHGVDSFSYVANDGQIDSGPALIQVTVLNSNNPPAALAMDLITKTNRALTIDPEGEDIDGDPLTFELVTTPAHGAAELDRERFRYTPSPNYAGPDSFTFRAFDGTAYSEPALVKIAVIVTNIAPRALDSSVSFQPNSTNQLRLAAKDPDGDAVSFTLLSRPLHGRIEGAAPELTYVPEPDYEGPDRLTFKAADPFAESAAATVTIKVERQNRPPEARDQVVAVPPDLATPIALDAGDPDGDVFQTVILKGPGRGRVYGFGTNYVYRPAPQFTGPDFFTYKLWDGQKFGKEARVTVNVSFPEPADPVAFESLRLLGNAIELLILPGSAHYSLESSVNLLDWAPLAGPLAGGGAIQSYVDTNARGARRFYRAVAR